MLQAGVFAGLALVLALAAVLLWRHANSGQRRAASSAFLEDQLRRGRGAPVSGKMPFCLLYTSSCWHCSSTGRITIMRRSSGWRPRCT